MKILKKVNKTIGLLHTLQNVQPRSALINIYKSFIRSYVDEGNIIWPIYDQAYNASFHQELELLQYNACLAITGAIRGTSREKLYKELILESLQQWLFNSELPHYLFKLIPSRSSSYVTRNIHNIHFLKQNILLRLGLSYLREHKFKYSFQDSLNLFCSCGLKKQLLHHKTRNFKTWRF